MKSREQINLLKREYYKKNKNKILAENKAWRLKNTKTLKLKKKEYAKINSEKLKAKSMQYYYDNIKEVNKKNNERYQKNRIKISSYGQKPEVKERKKELKIINNERNKILRRIRYSKNKEKEMARTIAHIIPLKCQCEICGSTTRLERHHWRYDNAILINTLCRNCHEIQHIKNFYTSKWSVISNEV
jgi:hypothetical protein